MDAQYLHWIGYIGSGIIALSMTMNSILKFRWINLIGAATFSLYGFLIDAYPVMILNGFILLVDVFYLVKIYTKKQLFDTLEVKSDNKYLIKFLDFYHDDIQKFYPEFEYKPEMNSISFFILRNTLVAGLFLAHTDKNNNLCVGLDYATPEYRDYKNGRFVLNLLRNEFKDKGFTKVVATSSNPQQNSYLKKLGFAEIEKNRWAKEL